MIGPMLAKISDSSTGNYWYRMLADVEFALNNTIQKSTGTTPSKLLFGVNQRGNTKDELAEYLEQAELDDSTRDFEKIRSDAGANIKKSQDYNKMYFDKKRKTSHEYAVGDLVMVKNFDTSVGTSKKLIPQFKGPYEIVKKLRNDRYVLNDPENFQLTQKPYVGTWEACNMKPWCREIVALICEAFPNYFSECN